MNGFRVDLAFLYLLGKKYIYSWNSQAKIAKQLNIH